MIEFRKDYQFVLAVFVYPANDEHLKQYGQKKMDWAGWVYFDENKYLNVQYRFHYYTDSHDGAGDRNWYGFVTKEPVDKATETGQEQVAKMIESVEKMAYLNSMRNGNSSFDLVDLECMSGPEAIEKLKEMPWFHIMPDNPYGASIPIPSFN